MKTLIFAVALTFPAAALACGGDKTAADTTAKTEVQLAAVSADATKSAKKAALVGDNCAYSTGMMAQKVHTNGSDLTVTGNLATQTKMLDSHVAAPYLVDDLYVIANEVVEQIDPSARVALTGKTMEIDGVKYFLVTSFEAKTS